MRVTLARMRENANLTQAQLSRSAAISQGYYSDIEGGLRCPSPRVALRIAHVLGIGEADMYGIFYAHNQTVSAHDDNQTRKPKEAMI